MIDLIRSDVAAAGVAECVAYVMGALRDGTFNRRHRTWRVAQANVEWLQIVQQVLSRVWAKGWIYREGSSRSVWVLETTFRPAGFRPETFVPPSVDRAFARGYFDAEGGIPKEQRNASTYNLPRRTTTI